VKKVRTPAISPTINKRAVFRCSLTPLELGTSATLMFIDTCIAGNATVAPSDASYIIKTVYLKYYNMAYFFPETRSIR
jgi:hypothetical protein